MARALDISLQERKNNGKKCAYSISYDYLRTVIVDGKHESDSLQMFTA